METQQFRIGHVAQELNLERFVIRFWEKEFNIKPNRSEGGQRFYSPDDLKKFKTIQQLLHHEGFTIAGAKKYLKEHGSTIIASKKTTIEESLGSACSTIKKELITLKKQLISLKKHL